MDKRRGTLNIIVSISFKIVILVVAIVVRRFIINYIGNEINGLNSLYVSILEFLSIAELGVGGAITYCMYKPIVENRNEEVSALYHLFKKLYLIIGGIILVGGCFIMLFLPYLAKDYQSAGVNLYLTFGLMLISVVMTYLFSAKTSLINAYKNNYITTAITSVAQIIQDCMQIFVLFYYRSFEGFLICRIIAVAIQWCVTEMFANKKYKYIIKCKAQIDINNKKTVVKNVKAMFAHKIGGILVNTADSLIISAFIGIVVLGKYSNYTTIMVAMTGVITLLFSSLTSVIGHMNVEENVDAIIKYHNFFHIFNFIVGLVFFLGYYSVIDDLIIILFGKDLLLDKTIPFIITINYFIQYMRQATLLFRDATGTFYNDRWKPFVEGTINVVLSILFVNIFPEKYNVVGVIIATIITNLFICHIIEPYVLYKYAFKSSAKKYYLQNYLFIVIFVICLTCLHFSMVSFEQKVVELLVNGLISIAISLTICILVLLLSKEVRGYFKYTFAKKFKRKSDSVKSDNVNENK